MATRSGEVRLSVPIWKAVFTSSKLIWASYKYLIFLGAFMALLSSWMNVTLVNVYAYSILAFMLTQAYGLDTKQAGLIGLALPCADFFVANTFSIVVDKLGQRYKESLIYVRKGLVCSIAFLRAGLFFILFIAADNLISFVVILVFISALNTAEQVAIQDEILRNTDFTFLNQKGTSHRSLIHMN